MEKNTAWKEELCARASREYDAFAESLKEMTFDEMSECAYELAMKQDILEMLKQDFPDDELKGLADAEMPLEMIYRTGMNYATEYLDYVRKSVEKCSWNILDAQGAEFYKEPDAPLYCKSRPEAISVGEEHMWRNDKYRSMNCLDQFNENIKIRDNRVDFSDFLTKWVGEFGLERCKTVLAMVVKDAMYDGRYDRNVKENAAAMPTPNKAYEDLYSNVHPVIINEVYKKLMEMERSKGISKGGENKKPPQKTNRKQEKMER